MEYVKEALKILIPVITDPEVIEMIGIVIVSILIKNKIITEVELNKAKNILSNSTKTPSDITDVTRLTINEVQDVLHDPNKKTLQRAFRKIIRGWI